MRCCLKSQQNAQEQQHACKLCRRVYNLVVPLRRWNTCLLHLHLWLLSCRAATVAEFQLTMLQSLFQSVSLVLTVVQTVYCCAVIRYYVRQCNKPKARAALALAVKVRISCCCCCCCCCCCRSTLHFVCSNSLRQDLKLLKAECQHCAAVAPMSCNSSSSSSL
jgi:hypothetical protein